MAQNKKSNKTNKKVMKTAKKMAKKSPAAFIVIVILVIALAVGFYFLWANVIGPQMEKNRANNNIPEQSEPISSSEPTSSSSEISSSSSSSPKSSSSIQFTGDVAPIDINFLELGNKYTGDSTFIKAGDVDILIDAGSRQNSAATISAFIGTYCTDGILEYVIATHAHQDHIAGFVGTNAAPGILKSYKVDTLIDFSLTNATSAIYNSYISLRDEKVASGDVAHHYTANDCIQETNGAKKVYDLAPGITMEILDQKFYREKTSDENDYSVCALFTQGDNHYLFTGDLEKDGEASLVALNTLPEVELFKGGHHGSYTANTDTLLNVIKPKNVCICCCAGSEEYTDNPDNMFPAQAAINRMAKWTDKIYVTTLMVDYKNGQYESMNGNINFHSAAGKEYLITGSHNSIILKETDWFKSNRTWPTY